MKSDEKYSPLSYKQRVTGSNPVAPTQYMQGFQRFLKPFLFLT